MHRTTRQAAALVSWSPAPADHSGQMFAPRDGPERISAIARYNSARCVTEPRPGGLSLRVSPDAWERSGLRADDGGIGGDFLTGPRNHGHGPVAAFPESYID